MMQPKKKKYLELEASVEIKLDEKKCGAVFSNFPFINYICLGDRTASHSPVTDAEVNIYFFGNTGKKESYSREMWTRTVGL